MRERGVTPLERRVATPLAWLLAAVFCSIGGLIVLRMHHVVRGGEARLLARVAAAAPASGRLPRVDGVRLAVVGSGGRVVAGALPHGIASALAAALRAPGDSTFRHGDETVAVHRVVRMGRPAALVAASRLPEADQQRLVAVEAEGLVPIGLAALGVAILLFERAARAHRRRIERLGAVAARLDRGELDARTGERPRDEVGGVGVQLDELAGRLQSLERARGTVLSQVSHDLRSPLALIRAYAWTLRRDEASTARSARLQTIEEEAERVATLVDDLLLVGRRRADAPRDGAVAVADVGALVTRAVERRQGQALDAGRELLLEASGAGALAEIRADAVERIVGNLVDNALRHAARRVVVRVATVGSAVELSCEDDGPGIPDDELERLFDPFWRGAPGGSGLGLAITRELADEAAGSVRAERGPAGGARFVVELPRAGGLVGGLA